MIQAYFEAENAGNLRVSCRSSPGLAACRKNSCRIGESHACTTIPISMHMQHAVTRICTRVESGAVLAQCCCLSSVGS
jgi:hypothetical protein